MKTVKRCFAGALAALVAAGTIPTTGMVARAAQPDVTIRTAEELVQFSNSVNSGTSYQGQTVALGADIDLSGVSMSPIGTQNAPFKGTFNGQGYDISNLTIASGQNHQGLFGYVSGGAIEHVDLVNVDVTGGWWVGGLAGFCNGDVSNCTVNGQVQGGAGVGGVVGGLVGKTMTDCINQADVSGADFNVGGLSGYMEYLNGVNPKMQDCVNQGTVTGSDDIGGITGRLTYGEIQDCTNRGDVRTDDPGSSGKGAGGIVGYLENGTVNRTANLGGVDGTTTTMVTGGVVGYGGSGSVTNCYNRGDVQGNTAGGGIAGGLDGNVPVQFCYTTGSITSVSREGSVVGWNRGGQVSSCVYNVEVDDGAAFGSNEAGGTAAGKTTDEMKTQEAYSGFDFTTVWQLTDANDGYPVFKDRVEGAQEQVDADYEWLTFSRFQGENTDMEQVTEHLDLPFEGPYGSEIFWSTSDAGVMLNSGAISATTQQTQQVTLTAKIRVGDVEREKTFTLAAQGSEDNRPLHILQVGDSNTEFGRVTQGMNKVLKKEYGDYGDGFLTLARDYVGWKGLRPDNFTITYAGQWGQHDMDNSGNLRQSPFGIYVDTATAGSTITVEFVGSAVDVYYLEVVNGGNFSVTIDGENLGVVSQNTTTGAKEPSCVSYDGLDYGQHTLVLRCEGGYINFLGADYRVDQAQVRKNISTWGNGGIQAYEYANTLDGNTYQEYMTMLDPDVVVILIGTNDNGIAQRPVEQLRESVTTMVQRTKQAMPQADIWVVATFETYGNSSDILQSYWDEGFPQVAQEQGVHYWSMGEWFGPYNSNSMEDGWHCNFTAGYDIAETLHGIILAGENVVGRNVAEIHQPQDITVRPGTAFDDLPLPTRVEVTLDDYQNLVTTADVVWTAGEYDPEGEGTCTLTGTILGDEDQRIYNPQGLTCTITVTKTPDAPVVTEPGLKLYYDFSNVEGGVVADLAGNYDGRVNGNVTVGEGISGDALYFPGNTNSYVDIPVEAFSDVRDMTISMWTRLDQVNTWTTLLGIGSDTTNYFQLVGAGGLPCGFSAAIKDATGKEYRIYADQSNPVPTNEWCMLTLTQEGSVANLYINDQLVATSRIMRKTLADIVSAAGSTAHLGAPQVWPDPATHGLVDELKVYDYAFTAQQVKQAMEDQLHTHQATAVAAVEPTCTQPGNIAYWYCTECGKYFADEACTQEITQEDTVREALGHHFENGVCTECGEKDPAYVETNKVLLQKTYDYALTLSTEGVTDSAVAAFETALANAKTVLDKQDATQDEINAAWDALLEGIWGLGLTQGDKTLLEQLITKAESMVADQDKYLQDNWQTLVDALAAAKDVMADGDAMDEDIQPAAEALLSAILAQRFKADKSILEDLIGKAEGMDLSGYTAQSVATFRTALANAQAVLADATLSEDDQAQVDAAVAALSDAMNGLTADGAPETTHKPQASQDPETTQKPQATQKPENVPQTGDSSMVMVWAGLMVLAGMAACAAVWAEKKHH